MDTPETATVEVTQAIELIDELNERATSRQFYGINQTLHEKLCTIRATLRLMLHRTRATRQDELREATIEECAALAENWNPGRRDRVTETGIANAIRALSDSSTRQDGLREALVRQLASEAERAILIPSSNLPEMESAIVDMHGLINRLAALSDSSTREESGAEESLLRPGLSEGSASLEGEGK